MSPSGRLRFVRLSLTARMFVGTCGIVGLVVGLAVLVLNVSLARTFWSEQEKDVDNIVKSFARAWDRGKWQHQNLPDLSMPEARCYIRIVSPDGVIQKQHPNFPANITPYDIHAVTTRWIWLAPQSLVAGHIVSEYVSQRGDVVQAAKIGPRSQLLWKSQTLLWTGWALCVMTAAIAVSWAFKRGLAPLQRLGVNPASLQPDALQLVRGQERVPSELEPLAAKWEEALARLNDAFFRLSALSADMAHDLRTPLHAIRLEMEHLLEGNRLDPEQHAATEDAFIRLDGLVAILDQMLFLAKLENPVTQIRSESLEIATLFRAALAPFISLTEEREIRVVIKVPERMVLDAEESMARRALHNILSNAIRHSRVGGTLTLDAIAFTDWVVLSIRDEGDGIPEELLQNIGHPFLRADLSRSRNTGGAGLGLAIAQSILRFHGGNMEIHSEVGKGTDVRLRFPRRLRQKAISAKGDV